MSLIIYGIELLGGTYSKYIVQINKFINCSYQNGYIPESSTSERLSQTATENYGKKLESTKITQIYCKNCCQIT